MALGADGLVILVCQRDSSVEEPAKGDIYTVGVTAKIKQLVKTEDGVYRTLMEPVARTEITDFYRVGKYAIAEGLEKTAEYTGVYEDNQAVLREIRKTVAEISSLMPMFSDDVYAQVNRTKDISLLCDFLAANIIADIEKRQELLEIFNPEQRAVAHGRFAGDKLARCTRHKPGRSADCQTVCSCFAAQANVRAADILHSARAEPQKHAGRFRRLDVAADHIVAVELFQSVADAARRAADAAGQIHDQRVRIVYRNLHGF